MSGNSATTSSAPNRELLIMVWVVNARTCHTLQPIGRRRTWLVGDGDERCWRCIELNAIASTKLRSRPHRQACRFAVISLATSGAAAPLAEAGWLPVPHSQKPASGVA